MGLHTHFIPLATGTLEAQTVGNHLWGQVQRFEATLTKLPRASGKVLKLNSFGGFFGNSKNIDMNCGRDLSPRGDQRYVKMHFFC